MIRFIQRHPRLAARLHRSPLRSLVSRLVWAELERDPAFVASVNEGLADLAAGRFVPWRDIVGDRSPAHRLWLDAVGLPAVGQYEQELDKPGHVPGEYLP